MITVEVVGAGAVAQLLCRDLLQRGCSVQLSVPQRNRTGQQQQAWLAELAALPWLQGVRMDATTDQAPLRLFAGTVEQWLEYQDSPRHQSTDSPVLLLTSWWQSLNSLQKQLRGKVLPVYPCITVESWQGRLAALGKLQLELPCDSEPGGMDRASVHQQLDQLGITWLQRDMEGRFKALFARTTFAYWYLLFSLEPRRHGKAGIDRAKITSQWRQVEALMEKEIDLQIPLTSLEFAMAYMRNGDPVKSDAAWILQVLLEHKRKKMDYFLKRQDRFQ
jgi:hypothetical protein